MNRSVLLAALVAGVLLSTVGCTTKSYVRNEVTPTVNKVNEFGVPLIKWIAQEYPAYITEINTTGKLSDELAANITAAINKFKEMQK